MKNLFSFFSKTAAGLCPLGEAAPGFTLLADEIPFDENSFSMVSDSETEAVWESDTLRITASYTPDEIHNAVVYRFSAQNIAAKPVRLHKVRSLDIRLLTDHEDVYVHTFYGGNIDFSYPPRNFSETCFVMNPAQRNPEPLWEVGRRVQSQNGRSSDCDLPIAILEDKLHTGGMFLSVLWSGDWYMEFFKQHDGAFHVFGGMQFLDMVLDPNEIVTLPEILIGAYEGDYDAGANAMRRYIRDTCLRRFSQEQQTPPVSYDHWFGLGAQIDEELMKKQAERLDGLGFEYFVMDAGWYYNDAKDAHDFHYGTGNFTRVDERKFPNGLSPLYDYLRELDLMGGLWFEPERAGPQSIIAADLPEAMLSTAGAGDIFFASDLHLVNFGHPKAIAYTKAFLKKYFEEQRLRWIRWDFNINPRSYWRENDRPDRRGETELAHMSGLYEILEWINTEYPQVLIEGCASGGQRMDLKTMRFSPTFWCSDQTYNTHISRFHLTAGNRILPGILLNRALTPMFPQGEDIPDFHFMSLFAGAFAINDPVQYWSETTRERCKKHIAVYKLIREFICDDYYPLFPEPKSLADDEGWEFLNPDTQRGFFQLFRSEGERETVLVSLKGLENGDYILRDPYTGETSTHAAEELQKGIPYRLDPFSSLLRLFEKK